MNYNQSNRQPAGKKPAGRQPGKSAGFPIVPVILIVVAFLILVYSAASIVVFYHSIDVTSSEAAAEAAGETTKSALDFTTSELFGIKDASSTPATMLLFLFCTLSFAAVVVIVLAVRKIAKSGLTKTIKTLLIIVAILLSLVLSAFITYEVYQVQLDIFKADKDVSSGDLNDVCQDSKGVFYILDGNGTPILPLEINDDITNDVYTTASAAVGISDIDTLYVSCRFTAKDGSAMQTPLTKDSEITITDYYIEDADGKQIKLDVSCLNKEKTDPILYELKMGGVNIKYKLLTTATGERSDPDAMTTFLIVGKDRVALNTDVMILVSLHEESGKYSADILQIPRDTYCRDNSSNNKINAVYGSYYNASDAADDQGKITDGMTGLVSMLERNWLIKIDYWALMNLDGFSDIVDGIGGVDMYVPFDMKYNDYSAVPPLVIDLKEGQQTLHGDQAEQFIRFRKGYVTGDLGRVDATKIFLTAFFCKLRSELAITNPAAITSTVGALMTYMTTDMDTGNAVNYVKKVLKLSLEDITFLSLPGSDWAKDNGTNASYYTSNRDGLYYVINRFFNVYDTDISKTEFDASRMFTSSSKNSDIEKAHKAAFDEEKYVENLEGAAEIKEDNDNGENNLPTLN